MAVIQEWLKTEELEEFKAMLGFQKLCLKTAESKLKLGQEASLCKVFTMQAWWPEFRGASKERACIILPVPPNEHSSNQFILKGKEWIVDSKHCMKGISC